MVSTPNFDELKVACGSDEVKHCFKFLFVQEESEHSGFIRKLVEWCDGLHDKIAKFADLMQEGQSFSHFDIPAMDGMECLAEAQAKNGEILQALLGVLDLAREAREDKRRHVMVMEVHD
ncbi:hypothetical protein CTI12_AA036280 [Artemisia annua]|uniref:Uncharacterized protein n=1 Tax=Artemisia annua TaxID=35608 RepID=A0A2U1QFD8_ARTAN|nr:hypothetical protein CTI12_AA036280 [Artemisia annua]